MSLAKANGVEVDDWGRCLMSLDEEFYDDIDEDPTGAHAQLG